MIRPWSHSNWNRWPQLEGVCLWDRGCRGTTENEYLLSNVTCMYVHDCDTDEVMT